jgi:ribonuclease HI
MNCFKPKYQLFLEAGRPTNYGGWRFVLQASDGLQRVEVEDVEPEVRGERLLLLTTVRALEALDQPSQVMIHGGTAYLRQGIQFGISEWRANDWQWERFGQMTPVKNVDLWQRLEHLLGFHGVEFRQWRFDAPQPTLWGGHLKPQSVPQGKKALAFCLPWNPTAVRRRLRLLRRSAGEWVLMLRRRLAYRLLGAG